MRRRKWEQVPADRVRPSDIAEPISADHEPTKVLTVRDSGICLVIDGTLTGLLPKDNYTFRRKV